ncbi:MAG TPA: sulfite exporter TauE/SafE family protein [Methylomirabilota bacterium]|nr:sulfite exporter TauE/SafE family protein [Methylomirabilota bacterium]
MARSTTPREIGQQDPLIWIIGLAAGLGSAFLGMGGGLVLVPALTLILRRPITQAIGTSLAVVLFISFAAVMADWELSGARIQWTWTFVLGAGALIGSMLGVRLIGRIADNPLRLVLAGALFAASIPAWTGWVGPKGPLVAPVVGSPAAERLLLLVVGFGAGLFTVLTGVGGGLATIPGLTLFVGGLPVDAIRATSLAAIVVAALIGAREHALLGNVDRQLATVLVPAGLTGAVLGVVSAAHFPTRVGELVFATLLVFAAAGLLAQVFYPSVVSGWSSPHGRHGRQAGANAP